MLTVLLGLLGLSFVVVIHEFGHFLAARALGVEVEVFSIGWGPKLLGFKKKKTEWRLSAFPLGGFCKMKGEEDFKLALEKKLPTIPTEEGSFYGAKPWKRILILVAGPFANIILAVILFSVVSLAGITIQTAPNRIILASEIHSASAALSEAPADKAGLRTGDIITAIDGEKIRDYSDLQEAIGLNPGKNLLLSIERDGARLALPVTPRLDKNSGQGLIGIFSWIDPKVDAVDPNGSAAIAGIRAGDVITGIEGRQVKNTVGILAALESKPEKVAIDLLRKGQPLAVKAIVSYDAEGQSNMGLSFTSVTRTEKATSLVDAVAHGWNETGATFAMSVKGIGLLFSGVNVLKAVSGPARITYMVGDTAKRSIEASGFSGITTIISFLAFLSVSLFLMNLLPIPALDGGQILLSIITIGIYLPWAYANIMRYVFSHVSADDTPAELPQNY
ncbi:MAG: RIP metalloprotease RseP [Spirochaetae bacterium HGW-Spirochaetae-9]|nr:MAG: RIP metalloprotease RseP [Spirochaetae bacterium HGW-Spirochaetae-9]